MDGEQGGVGGGEVSGAPRPTLLENGTQSIVKLGHY